VSGRIGAAPRGKFQDIWIDPCEAARDVREAFGLEEVLAYFSLRTPLA
jgi:hypothetical protein